MKQVKDVMPLSIMEKQNADTPKAVYKFQEILSELFENIKLLEPFKSNHEALKQIENWFSNYDFVDNEALHQYHNIGLMNSLFKLLFRKMKKDIFSHFEKDYQSIHQQLSVFNQLLVSQKLDLINQNDMTKVFNQLVSWQKNFGLLQFWKNSLIEIKHLFSSVDSKLEDKQRIYPIVDYYAYRIDTILDKYQKNFKKLKIKFKDFSKKVNHANGQEEEQKIETLPMKKFN